MATAAASRASDSVYRRFLRKFAICLSLAAIVLIAAEWMASSLGLPPGLPVLAGLALGLLANIAAVLLHWSDPP